MTTRLTRWLTTLDNFEAKMAQLPAVRRYGRLTRATGLVLEAVCCYCFRVRMLPYWRQKKARKT